MDPDYGASESYRQGWMRTTTNKNVRIEKWADRFFVLRQDFVLHYFLKNTDKVRSHIFKSSIKVEI